MRSGIQYQGESSGFAHPLVFTGSYGTSSPFSLLEMRDWSHILSVAGK